MRYAFAMRSDEATAKEILKRFDFLIGNLERAEQRGEKTGTAMLGAMYAAMEATLRVVPAEYGSMRGLNMSVQWASVYANMVNTGKLPPNGALVGKTYEKFLSKLTEKFTKTQNEKGYSIAKEMIQELGVKKLDAGFLKVADKCRIVLNRYLKDQAWKRIEQVKKMAYPTVHKGRKSPRGKMDSEHYKAMNTMYTWLKASDQQVASREAELESKIAEEQTKFGEVDFDQEKVDSLQQEQSLVHEFGCWDKMSVEEAEHCSKAFVKFVLEGKRDWADKLAYERLYFLGKRRAIIDRIGRSNANARSASKSVKNAREGGRRAIKGAVVDNMSLPQLLRSLEPQLGKAYSRELIQKVADAGAWLRIARQDTRNAFHSAARKATGLNTEKEIVRWLNEFEDIKEHTGIHLAQINNESFDLPFAEAERWAMMSDEEYTAEVNKPGDTFKPNAWEIMLIKHEVMEARAEKKRPAEISVRNRSISKQIELQDVSRAQVANAILLFEQDDYKHLIYHEGIIPKDSDGKELKPEEDKDWIEKMDLQVTLKELYDFVGADGMRFAYGLRDYVMAQGRKMARVYEERMGVPLVLKDKYWRRSFDLGKVDEKQDLSKQNGLKPDAYGFLISRIKHTHRIEWNNSVDSQFNFIAEAQANYIYLSGISWELKRLLGNAEFARDLQAAIGVEKMTALRQWIMVYASFEVENLLNDFEEDIGLMINQAKGRILTTDLFSVSIQERLPTLINRAASNGANLGSQSAAHDSVTAVPGIVNASFSICKGEGSVSNLMG